MGLGTSPQPFGRKFAPTSSGFPYIRPTMLAPWPVTGHPSFAIRPAGPFHRPNPATHTPRSPNLHSSFIVPTSPFPTPVHAFRRPNPLLALRPTPVALRSPLSALRSPLL